MRPDQRFIQPKYHILLSAIVLLITPSILFAASTHCLDGFVLLCIRTPIGPPRSEALKVTPPMLYLNFLLPFPMCITEHLSTLNSICQSLAHAYNISSGLLSV